MFTGIVETIGRVEKSGNSRLTIAVPAWKKPPIVSESVAVEGACLTVVESAPGQFTAEVMPETLKKTTLGGKKKNDSVNLERPLKAGDRLHGHFVTGHVDAVGTVAQTKKKGNAIHLNIRVPAALSRWIAPKGSIALNGVSLTVIEAEKGTFSVALIPYTRLHTTLETLRAGNKVNIETDILAKYLKNTTS